MRIAVECFADLDLFEFLRDDCGFASLTDHHAYSQGEVINAVFRRGRADAGIVDEDPGRPHHSLRDRTRPISQGVDIDVRELDGKRLYLVKPNLEICFLRAMARVKEKSWFETPSRMHRILASSTSREHKRFKEELGRLRSAEIAKSMPGLVSELLANLR